MEQQSKFIVDKSEIVKYSKTILVNRDFGNLPEQDKYTFIGILQVRGKYAKPKHNKTINIHKFTFSLSPDEPEKLYKLLKTRFGNIEDWLVEYNIELHELVLYITLKPRDDRKAANQLVKQIVDDFYHSKDNFNLKEIMFRSLHKSALKCGRLVLDFDLTEKFDTNEPLLVVCEEFGFLEKGYVGVVETRGGYHLYLDLTKMDSKQKEAIFTGKVKEFASGIAIDGKSVFKDVEVKTDSTIVVPGVMQGGFVPKLFSLLK